MGRKCRPTYFICGCVFPQRLVMAIVCALGVIVCTGQRDKETIGVAVYIHGLREANNTTEVNITHIHESNIDMSDIIVNLMLSAFPVGHFIGQLPAGMLADELGARWLFFTGVAISTGLTFISPSVIRYCNLLIVHCVRTCVGLSQSVLFPCISVLLIRWAPIEERGKLGGMTYGMYPLGTIIANSVGDALRMRDVLDWPRSFYIWGGVGSTWCLISYFLIYDTPDKHPRITDEERDYLDRRLPKATKLKTSFKMLLSNHGIWALIIGQIGHNFTLHLMMVDVPWNLNKVADLSPESAILSSMSAFIGFWVVSILSGIVMDYGVVKKHWNLKWTRRIATYINFVIPNTLLCITFYVQDYKIALMVCYGIALLFSGPYGASFRINHMDITINFVGTVTSLINVLGDIVAFILFFVLRVLTKQTTVRSWEINTWVAFTLNMVCTTHYLFTAEVERAYFDLSPEEKVERDKEIEKAHRDKEQRKEDKAKKKAKGNNADNTNTADVQK